MFVVYALTDPRVSRLGEIRYIGQTMKSLKSRLRGHLHDAKTRKHTHHTANWIRALDREGLSPEIRPLQSCETQEQTNNLEKLLISLGRLYGNVTNSAEGGGAGPFSETHRAALSRASIAMWTARPELRDALAASNTARCLGVSLSEAHCVALAESWTEERRAKYIALMSAWWTPEHRAEHGVGVTARQTGIPHSAERKKAIARSWEDADERRTAQSARFRGVPKSAAAKAKMSESARKRWERERVERMIAVVSLPFSLPEKS